MSGASKRPEPLDPLIQGYLDYLRDVGRKAEGTVRDVRCSLRRVCRRMEDIRPGVELWKVRLEDFLAWIEQERESGCSPPSLCKYLSHVRGLLDYAWRSGRAGRNVLDGFNLRDESRRTIPSVLSIEEARRLVEHCPADTPGRRRDRMMILLLYGCGLRTAELCGLDVGDVSRERRELTVRRGKGDRQRVIPIPDGVFTELLAYLLERNGKRGPLLRTDAKKARINAACVCNVVRRACERAGLNRWITAKTLRHSYATHLMDRGVDVGVICSLMGHRNVSETGVYLHALEGRTREAVDRLGGEGGNGAGETGEGGQSQ